MEIMEMRRAVSALQTAMQMTYGAEYLRKWSGFTPDELCRVWSRKFQTSGIPSAAVIMLADAMTWEHPPTVIQIVDALEQLQAKRARDAQFDATRNQVRALRDDSKVADPNSPVVKTAMAEMRKFLGAHVVGGRA